METLEQVNGFPLVSVVMINWNRKDILRQTLANFKRQTYPRYEIIIADNASIDGAADMVEKEFPEVKIIRLKQNLGIQGYNIALEKTCGEYIVIVDNDSFLEDEGISKIVGKFQQFPVLGALGCRVYYYYSGEVHHWHPVIRGEDCLGKGFDSPLFNGCAAAVRASVLKKVGFYPEEFFLYENERDLCTRIINAGYLVKYFTDINAYHMVSPDNSRNERLVFYATRNLIWYFWKYMPVHIALQRSLFIIAASIVLGVRRNMLGQYLKAVIAAIIGLPKIIRRRKPIEKKYVAKVLY